MLLQMKLKNNSYWIILNFEITLEDVTTPLNLELFLDDLASFYVL